MDRIQQQSASLIFANSVRYQDLQDSKYSHDSRQQDRFMLHDTHSLCGGDEGNSETGGNTQRGSYGAQQPCWALSGLSGVCVHALVGFRV